MQKQTLQKNSSATIGFIAVGDKGVHAFPKGINPNMKVVARLEFVHTMLQLSRLTTTPRGLPPRNLVGWLSTYHV